MASTPTDLPGKTVRATDNTAWYVSEMGSGPPLVLLHAFPFDRRLWHHQLRGLSDRFRVIAPDLPGFGNTPLGDQPFTLADVARRLADLLDQLELNGPVHLAGVSMGGYIAFEFWDQFPDRLDHLILCDTKAAADTAEARENRHTVAERALQSGMEPIARAMLPKLLSSTTRTQRTDVVAQCERMVLETSPETVAAAQRAMAGRRDFTQRLSEIECPVLCIVGSEDPLSGPEEMRGIAEAVPRGRIEIIPDAGHLAPLEHPEPVNAAIRAFLRD